MIPFSRKSYGSPCSIKGSALQTVKNASKLAPTDDVNCEKTGLTASADPRDTEPSHSAIPSEHFSRSPTIAQSAMDIQARVMSVTSHKSCTLGPHTSLTHKSLPSQPAPPSNASPVWSEFPPIDDSATYPDSVINSHVPRCFISNALPSSELLPPNGDVSSKPHANPVSEFEPSLSPNYTCRPSDQSSHWSFSDRSVRSWHATSAHVDGISSRANEAPTLMNPTSPDWWDRDWSSDSLFSSDSEDGIDEQYESERTAGNEQSDPTLNNDIGSYSDGPFDGIHFELGFEEPGNGGPQSGYLEDLFYIPDEGNQQTNDPEVFLDNSPRPEYDEEDRQLVDLVEVSHDHDFGEELVRPLDEEDPSYDGNAEQGYHSDDGTSQHSDIWNHPNDEEPPFEYCNHGSFELDDQASQRSDELRILPDDLTHLELEEPADDGLFCESGDDYEEYSDVATQQHDDLGIPADSSLSPGYDEQVDHHVDYEEAGAEYDLSEGIDQILEEEDESLIEDMEDELGYASDGASQRSDDWGIPPDSQSDQDYEDGANKYEHGDEENPDEYFVLVSQNFPRSLWSLQLPGSFYPNEFTKHGHTHKPPVHSSFDINPLKMISSHIPFLVALATLETFVRSTILQFIQNFRLSRHVVSRPDPTNVVINDRERNPLTNEDQHGNQNTDYHLVNVLFDIPLPAQVTVWRQQMITRRTLLFNQSPLSLTPSRFTLPLTHNGCPITSDSPYPDYRSSVLDAMLIHEYPDNPHSLSSFTLRRPTMIRAIAVRIRVGSGIPFERKFRRDSRHQIGHTFVLNRSPFVASVVRNHLNDLGESPMVPNQPPLALVINREVEFWSNDIPRSSFHYSVVSYDTLRPIETFGQRIGSPGLTLQALCPNEDGSEGQSATWTTRGWHNGGIHPLTPISASHSRYSPSTLVQRLPEDPIRIEFKPPPRSVPREIDTISRRKNRRLKGEVKTPSLTLSIAHFFFISILPVTSLFNIQGQPATPEILDEDLPQLVPARIIEGVRFSGSQHIHPRPSCLFPPDSFARPSANSPSRNITNMPIPAPVLWLTPKTISLDSHTERLVSTRASKIFPLSIFTTQFDAARTFTFKSTKWTSSNANSTGIHQHPIPREAAMSTFIAYQRGLSPKIPLLTTLPYPPSHDSQHLATPFTLVLFASPCIGIYSDLILDKAVTISASNQHDPWEENVEHNALGTLSPPTYTQQKQPVHSVVHMPIDLELSRTSWGCSWAENFPVDHNGQLDDDLVGKDIPLSSKSLLTSRTYTNAERPHETTSPQINSQCARTHCTGAQNDLPTRDLPIRPVPVTPIPPSSPINTRTTPRSPESSQTVFDAHQYDIPPTFFLPAVRPCSSHQELRRLETPITLVSSASLYGRLHQRPKLDKAVTTTANHQPGKGKKQVERDERETLYLPTLSIPTTLPDPSRSDSRRLTTPLFQTNLLMPLNSLAINLPHPSHLAFQHIVSPLTLVPVVTPCAEFCQRLEPDEAVKETASNPYDRRGEELKCGILGIPNPFTHLRLRQTLRFGSSSFSGLTYCQFMVLVRIVRVQLDSDHCDTSTDSSPPTNIIIAYDGQRSRNCAGTSNDSPVQFLTPRPVNISPTLPPLSFVNSKLFRCSTRTILRTRRVDTVTFGKSTDQHQNKLTQQSPLLLQRNSKPANSPLVSSNNLYPFLASFLPNPFLLSGNNFLRPQSRSLSRYQTADLFSLDHITHTQQSEDILVFNQTSPTIVSSDHYACDPSFYVFPANPTTTNYSIIPYLIDISLSAKFRVLQSSHLPIINPSQISKDSSWNNSADTPNGINKRQTKRSPLGNSQSTTAGPNSLPTFPLGPHVSLTMSAQRIVAQIVVLQPLYSKGSRGATCGRHSGSVSTLAPISAPSHVHSSSGLVQHFSTNLVVIYDGQPDDNLGDDGIPSSYRCRTNHPPPRCLPAALTRVVHILINLNLSCMSRRTYPCTNLAGDYDGQHGNGLVDKGIPPLSNAPNRDLASLNWRANTTHCDYDMGCALVVNSAPKFWVDKGITMNLPNPEVQYQRTKGRVSWDVPNLVPPFISLTAASIDELPCHYQQLFSEPNTNVRPRSIAENQHQPTLRLRYHVPLIEDVPPSVPAIQLALICRFIDHGHQFPSLMMGVERRKGKLTSWKPKQGVAWLRSISSDPTPQVAQYSINNSSIRLQECSFKELGPKSVNLVLQEWSSRFISWTESRSSTCPTGRSLPL
ncbi:hypothetical protein PQX77_002726 [Marasmius sp. AFHP31]|nr:hypothetical protein PQX77_002726 [Marasmius sp. AFHP31]